MAYTHTQYEVIVAKDASLASAADIGDYAPGSTPHIVRKVALVFTAAVDATGQVKVDKRVTAGSDTGRGDGDIATLNYTTTTGAQGKVVQKSGLNVELVPGDEAVFQVTNATPTTGTAHLVMVVEPRWEQVGNLTDLAETS